MRGRRWAKYPMSRDVSDVTAIRASPMAVAPTGPRLLSLSGIGERVIVGKVTSFVVDVGSIPTGGALVVWPWTFGSRIA